MEANTPVESSMTSPLSSPNPRKRKLETLREMMESSAADVELKLTSSLYYLHKKEYSTLDNTLEKIRSETQASN